jgi:hypothetical protein
MWLYGLIQAAIDKVYLEPRPVQMFVKLSSKYCLTFPGKCVGIQIDLFQQ